jgi:hypothetical protein
VLVEKSYPVTMVSPGPVRGPVLDSCIDLGRPIKADVVNNWIDLSDNIVPDGVSYHGNLRKVLQEPIGNTKEPGRVDSWCVVGIVGNRTVVKS